MNYHTQHSDLVGRCQEGTGKWLLDSQEFTSWVAAKQQTLFCPGIPGAGKTMLSSIVVEHLRHELQNDNDVSVIFLYCSYKRQEEQKTGNLLTSALQQLVQSRPSVPEEVDLLYKCHRDEGTRPSIKEVVSVFCSIVSSLSKLYLAVDALDECASTERRRLVGELFKLQAQNQLNIFATSRDLPEIKAQFVGCTALEIRASKEDVRRYLENCMRELPRCVVQHADLQSKITTQILALVDGMYVFLALQEDYLVTCFIGFFSLNCISTHLDTSQRSRTSRIPYDIYLEDQGL